MKKKVLSVLLCISVITTILAGCSSSSSKDSASTGTEKKSNVTEEQSTETNNSANAENSNGTEGKGAENTSEDASGNSKGKTYGVTYWCESDFFATLADTIADLAEADGGTTTIVDANQDSDYQLSIIEDFISKGCDVVFLQPVDKDAIKPALLKLKEAGIYVVNFDSAVEDLDLVQAYIATNNYNAGVQCGEAMIKDFPNGGKIAVLDYPANNACVERTNGFLDTIDGHGFEIVTQLDAQGNNEQGLKITNDILQAHSDLVAMFCINDQCGMGAYAAITAAGDSIKIYGVDGAIEAKRAIANSDLYAMTAAQSPITIGKECYKAAQTLLSGGKLDKFKIEVEPFVIDKSNVDKYLDAPWQ